MTGTERTRRYTALAIESVGNFILAQRDLSPATFLSSTNELVVATVAERSVGLPAPNVVRAAELVGLGKLHDLVLQSEPAQIDAVFNIFGRTPASLEVRITDPAPLIPQPMWKRPEVTKLFPDGDEKYRFVFKPKQDAVAGDGWDMMHAEKMVLRGLLELQKAKTLGETKGQPLLYRSPAFDLVWEWRIREEASEFNTIEAQIEAVKLLGTFIKVVGINTDEHSLKYGSKILATGKFSFRLAPDQVQGNVAFEPIDGFGEDVQAGDPRNGGFINAER